MTLCPFVLDLVLPGEAKGKAVMQEQHPCSDTGMHTRPLLLRGGKMMMVTMSCLSLPFFHQTSKELGTTIPQLGQLEKIHCVKPGIEPRNCALPVSNAVVVAPRLFP